MNTLSVAGIKLYYRLLNVLLPRKKIKVPDGLTNSRNIFLYFDYEREFSGHEVRIGDRDIDYLLAIMTESSLKSTWFIVGRLFEKYPETILGIINNGHEVASHTYGHVAPISMTRAMLKHDFRKSLLCSPVPLSGFHSPKGRWSVNLLSCLREYGFGYDLTRIPGSQEYRPFVHLLPFGNGIIRLQTAGDDWPLFKADNSPEEVVEYFKNISKRIGPGEIGGLGFHPWILFSDQRILMGFQLFIEYLTCQEDVYLDTAANFVDRLSGHSGI